MADDMTLHDAIRTRRTVHLYRPDPVPDAVVDRALAAAHLAPCHRLTWPWRFLKVGKQTRVPLAALGVRVKEKRGALTDAQKAKVVGKILDPHALIVVTRILVEDAFQSREDFAATACAVQNLQLSITADGYGAKWSTGGLTRDAETYTLLGVDPALEQIEGFVWIGVPKGVGRVPRPELVAHVRELP